MTAPDRIERLTADQVDPTAADEWWTTIPAPPPAYDPVKGRAGVRGLLAALRTGHVAAERLGRWAVGAGEKWRHDGDVLAFAQAVDLIVALRRRLALTESYLLREAHLTTRDHDLERSGVFPDGRLFELKRGADRKAWQHDRWQADARAQVLSGLNVDSIVNTSTGEQVDLWKLLEAIEAVHGSGAPRTGVLKGLGLRPDDYCESVPGTLQLKVSAPGEVD